MNAFTRWRWIPCAGLPAAAVLLTAQVAGAAENPAQQDQDTRESGWQLLSLPKAAIENGVVVANHGAVLSRGNWYLLADSVRYELADKRTNQGDELWASGHVVLIEPGVRVEAKELGFHRQLSSGEAWDVDIEIESRAHTLRAHCEHLLIEPEHLILDHVHLDFGYGGILSLTCPRIRLVMPAKHRALAGRDTHAEAKAYVDSITFDDPTVRVIGVPVLWAPVLYRDFRYEEPWSRVALGSAKRQGDFVHYWLGVNLPAFDGWSTRLEGRYDFNDHAGEGYGLTGSWRNPRYGSGRIETFAMPKETVFGGPTDDTEVATRRSTLIDAEQQTDLGHGALYLRYVQEPAPDPLLPGTVPPIGNADERFRADYFPEDLNNRPFARQGGGIAYGFDWGTVVVDSEHNPRPEWTQTQTWYAVHVASVPLTLAGPFSVRASAWEQDLHQVWVDTAADRLRADGSIGFLQWLGEGVGVDAQGGGRALRYDNGRILGVAQVGDQERHVAYLTAGVRLRLEDDTPAWMHVVTPRIGIDLTSPGYGSFLPGYGFGDPGDTLEEDQRYYTVGLETAYSSGPRQVRAQVTTRWAMRSRDRIFVDPTTGSSYRGNTRFADISAQVEGQLGKALSLTGETTYDDRARRFTDLDATAVLAITPKLSLHHTVALNTSLIGLPVAPPNNLSNSPGISYIAGRYRIDTGVSMVPGGRAIDSYTMAIGRQMVDGILTLSYEIDYSQTGALYDQRFGLDFSLFANNQQAGQVGRGTGYSVH